jgi:hypothetical protein
MSNIRKYLADAQNRAHEGFVNADGFFDDDLNFTAGDDFMSANGDPMPAAAPTSQPYIIQISNTGSAVANFNVLGSYEQLSDTAAFTSGNFISGNVTISSAIPNVTYQQMLYQFMNNPFSTGLTYIQSSSSTQLLETISVQTKDANGNVAQKPLVPTIDPYQFQNSILASTTVKLYLYPADNINLARGLSGRAVSKDFSSPGIVRAQTVKIQG